MEVEDDMEEIGFISSTRKESHSGGDFLVMTPKKKKYVIAVSLVVVVVVILSAVVTLAVIGSRQSTSSPVDKSLQNLADYINAAVDTTADPCKDFYQYSCGKWVAQHQERDSFGDFSRSFSAAGSKIGSVLLKILEAREDPLLTLMYDDCTQARAEDLSPLTPWFTSIAAISTVEDLFEVVGSLHEYTFSALFEFGVSRDEGNPERNIMTVYQGGLSLPNKGFYTNNDQWSIYFRSLYVQYMAQVLRVIGAAATQSEAGAQAQAIMQFESSLAQISLDQSEITPTSTYNLMSKESFLQLGLFLPWARYLTAIKSPVFTEINVGMPAFFSGLYGVLNTTSTGTLKNYLKWQLASGSLDLIGGAALKAKVDFEAQVTGQKAVDPSKASACVGAVNGILGDLLGKYYAKTISPGIGDDAVELIGDIKQGFSKNLQTIDWMDTHTKNLTQAKLDAISHKVLFPYKWPDYSGVHLIPGLYFDNTMTLRKLAFENNLKSLGKADRSEWLMSPQTINAYYYPVNNEIVIPAAILQAPFYDTIHPSWSNFGGIAYVLGHEITHGFDNSGRQYDATGKLTNWWPQSVVSAFETRAECIVQKYDMYHPLSDVAVDGKATEGENIADLGGLRVAFMAYQHYREEGKDRYTDKDMAEYFPGWTEDQLFFITFGQLWCDAAGNDFAELAARTDVHSPAKFRVLGAVSSFDEFAHAFHCPQGSPMNPEKTCRVW